MVSGAIKNLTYDLDHFGRDHARDYRQHRDYGLDLTGLVGDEVLLIAHEVEEAGDLVGGALL